MRLLRSAFKRTIKEKVIVAPKLLVSRLCPLPSFLIIGAMKSGTTSLYDYMVQHPRIVRATFKEIRFFETGPSKGINWYRSHFPILLSKRQQKHLQITGEASPSYIFHPHAARRVYESIPGVKIIAVLRNPVDRAFSHYHHNVKIGSESRTFEEAIEAEEREEKTLNAEMEKMLKNANYRSSYYFKHTYFLARGRYVEQLRVWSDYFPKEQMLILKSENFYENPALTLQQVYKFLDLPLLELERYKVRNPGKYSEGMNAATKEYLTNYFKPHNKKLHEFLGTDLGWDR